ncbi:ABC transporter substrate-binding protein [Oscillospiraceae bacterium MB08-C2-2]|nr:ABC transporter substrate-binding protein [Oscillospiraceae bacterium MB08-C2-2]
MNIKKFFSVSMAICILLLAVTGCSGVESAPSEAPASAAAANSSEAAPAETPASDDQIVVGFSQPHSTSAWRVIQTESITNALKEAGYKVIYTDAQNNTQKQVSDVEDILAQKPDYLLLAPREEDGLVPALEAAQKAGVPVILLDRKVKGEAGKDYVTFIGSDYFEAGKAVAQWIVNETDGKCNIVEIAGTPGATSTTERAEGFRKGLEGSPEAVILASQVGDNKRVEAQKAMENMLQAYSGQIDVVFAQSDEMAFGVIQAMKTQGVKPNEDIMICTVDGIQQALESIIAGELTMSLYNNPAFGPYAIDVIQKLEKGEAVDQWIKVDNRIFDKNNAQESLNSIYLNK